ncbi:MAG: haloacid dehalogenase [Desulfobacterales bacterium]
MVKIDPNSVAFDIDGVVADTMSLFIDIARDEFNLKNIQYEQITSYSLEECLDINKEIMASIVKKLLDGNYSATLQPIKDAPQVLSRLGRKHGPVLFVTARPYPGPITEWILENLSLEQPSIEIVATGSFDAKAEILKDRNISYFVEDRLETCFTLKEAGITPILFKQPWNRKNSRFIEVGSWNELENLIAF